MLKDSPNIYEHVNRQGKDNCRILFGADFYQSLQVAKLDGGRLLLDQLRGHRKLLGSQILSLGVDDFSPSFTLSLCLNPEGYPDHAINRRKHKSDAWAP